MKPRKILSDDSISITPTAVRVPVYRSHSESVYVETEETITPDEARALMEAEPGLIVQDDPITMYIQCRCLHRIPMKFM